MESTCKPSAMKLASDCRGEAVFMEILRQTKPFVGQAEGERRLHIEDYMPEYDIALELARLHILSGADFIRQLKMLTSLYIFKPVENEKDIFAAEGSHREDFPMLLDAARKAVVHGNKVYILPNPKGIRTADFIFERKGVYKMFDLKTIVGRNSVGNRLKESIGLTNSVLLNLKCSYGVRNITDEIKHHFEMSTNAVEVLIYFGNKEISIKRNIARSKGFLKMMMNSFRK